MRPEVWIARAVTVAMSAFERVKSGSTVPFGSRRNGDEFGRLKAPLMTIFPSACTATLLTLLFNAALKESCVPVLSE